MFRTTMHSFHSRSGKHLADWLAHQIDVETEAWPREAAEPGREGVLGRLSLASVSSEGPKLPCDAAVCFQGSVLFTRVCFFT